MGEVGKGVRTRDMYRGRERKERHTEEEKEGEGERDISNCLRKKVNYKFDPKREEEAAFATKHLFTSFIYFQ